MAIEGHGTRRAKQAPLGGGLGPDEEANQRLVAAVAGLADALRVFLLAGLAGFREARVDAVQTLTLGKRAIGPATREGCPTTRLPRWAVRTRELWFTDKLVKRFRVPSPNQARVLAAFEEEGWPSSIDDPLPPCPEQNPKRRLHDTIRGLNRHQKEARIFFAGNGTGDGIIWRASQ
jgi:hypothetical protein